MLRPILSVIGLMIVVGSARAEDDAAIARLESLGGKVTRSNGMVTAVSFTDCSKLGEAEFRALGQLPHLKSLTLYGNCKGLTDETLPLLASLKSLETLGIDGAQLSDDGLKGFVPLQALKSISFFHLSFRKEGFRGTGFVAFKDLPKLQKLTVAGMSMGDEGFAAIAKITQLKDLATWHTYQTEAGNKEIAKLPNLVRLHLGQRLPHQGAKEPSLSEASITTLLQMKTLESLKLGEARFTGTSLARLKELPQLKQLSIYETDITLAEIEQLKKDLPQMKVEFQPLTAEQRKKLEMYLKQ